MKLTTAGESHGKGLVALIEGLPYALPIDEDEINEELLFRKKGYGRGERQALEPDHAEILTGVRHGLTLASPLTIFVKNNCYEDGGEEVNEIYSLRPGHADYAGIKKYGYPDASYMAERASARETVARVAAGAVFKKYLYLLGVEIAGYVVSVGTAEDKNKYAFTEIRNAKYTRTGMLDVKSEERAVFEIDTAKRKGETLGGVVEVRVKGLKAGFGNPMKYEDKLDARLSGNVMSIQACKGVEIGDGFSLATKQGKETLDELYPIESGSLRKTNHQGGIEGGMSNGEEIVLRAAMKPLPTQANGIKTVDIRTGKESEADSVRSDTCAVFAFERVVESAVAETVAKAVCERLGGDKMDEVKKRYEAL